jgi:hypothetical protein
MHMPLAATNWRRLMLLSAVVLCAGCPAAKPVEIVLPLAQAEFAGGQEVLFSAVAGTFKGSSITARWDFGDGTSAAGFTVQHAYDGQGTYTATVTVTNEFASTASDNVSITVTSSRFVKLSPDGTELPDNASLWAMVYDVTTELVWEMKNSRDFEPDYDNPHDGDNTYTWYDENTLTNGGDSGTPGAGTDTADFIDLINMQQLGGFTDWRMPDCVELASILDRDRFNPAINAGYFPDTASWYYWSATTYPEFPGSACHIDFFGSKPIYTTAARVVVLNHYGYKSIDYHARAVRGAD